MPWVRIDEEFVQHPKVVQVGPLGMVLQLAALCYANTHLTDGFIPHGAVRTLLDFNRIGENIGDKVELWCEIGAFNIVERLVTAGMWIEVEGGYQIHDFEDYQPPRAHVLAEREKTRLRVAKHRAEKRSGNATSNNGSNAVSNAPVTPHPVPVPVPVTTEGANAPVAQARPVSVDVALVWDTWQQATGKTRAKLDAKRERAIQRALKSHGLDDTLAAVQGWQHDPWEDRPRHVDVTVLLRDAEHIEKFRDLWRAGPAPPSLNGMGKARRQLYENSAALDAWVQQEETADDQGRVATGPHQAQRALPAPADTA